MADALAHTRIAPNGAIEGHPLEQHLRNTAKQAAEFAKAFGSEEWGHLAGLWHDLGKYQLCNPPTGSTGGSCRCR